MKTGFHPARELAEAYTKKALLHKAGTNRPVPPRLYQNATVSANAVVGKSRGRPTARAETQVSMRQVENRVVVSFY